MSWTQWPFRPRSLTDMIGRADKADNERFVALIVSGCSERLGRPLTVIEPVSRRAESETDDSLTHGSGPAPPGLRRIDQINPREHFCGLCDETRELSDQDSACQLWDLEVAHEVMAAATDDPQKLEEYARGYPCHMNLIDQAGVIQYDRTPVAVVLSGQFMPDGREAQRRVRDAVNDLIARHYLDDERRKELHRLVGELETRGKFINRYIENVAERDPDLAERMRAKPPTVDQLFMDEVREIEQIARAEFEIHKRDREAAFRHRIRDMFSPRPTDDRDTIAEHTEAMLKAVCEFCGTSYLALLVSPRRYISYEGAPNLLHPFVAYGIESGFEEGQLHFNWRKALRASGVRDKSSSDTNDADAERTPTINMVTRHARVRRVLATGLRGRSSGLLNDATLLCRVHMSPAYRGILIWGPFSHLATSDLHQESEFLEEISELVTLRVLASIQLADSERRTAAWGEVATLLSHYSRRAMTPVSTGARIISEYLGGESAYDKEDAFEACNSLEAASLFISQAVRAPLYSFAATAEDVYDFSPTSLDRVVSDCVSLYRPVAREKGVSIHVEPGLALLPVVRIDAAKMRDAIGYVLDNAIKYSHEDKEVRIYGRHSASHVELTIENFGLGIDPDELHLIFGRGYQGRRSKRALSEEGEGMGLFHARLIIEAHKGKITYSCRSGPRSEQSARLEGYRVLCTVELPLGQSG